MVRRITFHSEYTSGAMRTHVERLVFDSDQFEEENGNDCKKENGRYHRQFFILVVSQVQFAEGFIRRHESCASGLVLQ